VDKKNHTFRQNDENELVRIFVLNAWGEVAIIIKYSGR
jgi:hypothetical protein